MARIPIGIRARVLELDELLPTEAERLVARDWDDRPFACSTVAMSTGSTCSPSPTTGPQPRASDQPAYYPSVEALLSARVRS